MVSHGVATATATAFKKLLRSVTSAGVSTAVAAGIQRRFPSAQSSGFATASATGLKKQFPSVTARSFGYTVVQPFRKRLPTVAAAGTSLATATGFHYAWPNLTSAGRATTTAGPFRIKLGPVISAGAGWVYIGPFLPPIPPIGPIPPRDEPGTHSSSGNQHVVLPPAEPLLPIRRNIQSVAVEPRLKIYARAPRPSVTPTRLPDFEPLYVPTVTTAVEQAPSGLLDPIEDPDALTYDHYVAAIDEEELIILGIL
jgi:hypothetical protein